MSLMPLLGILHHRDDGETPTRRKAAKPDSCTGTEERGQGVLGSRICGNGGEQDGSGGLTLKLSDRGSERINIGGAFRLRTPPTQIRIKTPTLASNTSRLPGGALSCTPLAFGKLPGDAVAEPGTSCQGPAAQQPSERCPANAPWL